MRITLDDVRSAAARLDGVANRTPVVTSRTLDERTGAAVFVKAECFQRGGAFKFRGAYNKIASLSDDARRQGVLAYSSGNHAQAVALAARLLGTSATILMPEDAPEAKVDATKDWDEAFMRSLAALDRVRVVDLKAYYRGTAVDLAPDPALYRAVVDAFPGVVIEDAWLEDGCLEAFAGAEDRLSFDAPVHSLADFDALPIEARWLNVKPSRFGTVRRLLECVEACGDRGVRMYGGGQFELGHGRDQIQKLASVFYPDGPNDVAPAVYNEGAPRPDFPRSPLPAPDGVGF